MIDNINISVWESQYCKVKIDILFNNVRIYLVILMLLHTNVNIYKEI